MSADISTAEPDGIATAIVEAFGLPEIRPTWIHDTPDAGVKTYFVRPHLDRSNAPTTIEVIGRHPNGRWSAGLRAIHELQGDRPMKTHATVFGVAEIESYAERLDRLGVGYRFDPGLDGPLPFPKLWVGQDERNGVTTYDGTHDVGLVVELIPTAPLRLPPDAHAPPAIVAGDGAVVRVAARSFIVDDVDTATAVLERTFGWEPAGDASTSQVDQARVVSYRGLLPGSGALELLQPVGAGPVATHHARYGPGAYRITLAVNGLAAAADALDERSIRYDLAQGDDAEPARLRADPACISSMVFDLVEARH